MAREFCRGGFVGPETFIVTLSVSIWTIVNVVSGACDADWEAFDSRCYRLFSQTGLSEPFPGAVPEARALCRSHQSDLVTIRSAAEQTFVTDLASQPGDMPEWYIGMSDTLSENNFVWLDGSQLDYTDWKYDEPNNYAAFGGEHCGSAKIAYSGNWVDVPCLFNPNDRIKGVICEKFQDTDSNVKSWQLKVIDQQYFIQAPPDSVEIASVYVDSMLSCAMHCLQNDNCLSANYQKVTTSDGNMCVLNSATRYEIRDALTADNAVAGVDTGQWAYLEMQHPGF